MLQQARFGAAGNSELRRTGKAKYRTTMDKHKVVKEGWSIVATDDLTVQPVPGIEDGKPRIYSEAAQALRKLKQADPAKAAGLKILRLSEVREIALSEGYRIWLTQRLQIMFSCPGCVRALHPAFRRRT